MFILYRIGFRGATKSCQVECEHLSNMWLSTLEIGAVQLCSNTETARPQPFLGIRRADNGDVHENVAEK